MTQQENGWSHVINDQPLMLGADLKFDSVNKNETNFHMVQLVLKHRQMKTMDKDVFFKY